MADVTTSKEIQTLLETIRERRSYALPQLSPEPIDLAAVEVMLEAANWAPNHGKTEPWRFTVFAGEGRQGLSAAFGEAYRQLTPSASYTAAAEQAQRDRAFAAPVWISLGMQPGLNDRGLPRMPEWEEMIAVGCAVQNAQLAATAQGLGCKWTSGSVVTHPHVMQFIGLEAPARLLGFLYVGAPAGAKPAGNRRTLADKVRWVIDAPGTPELP